MTIKLSDYSCGIIGGNKSYDKSLTIENPTASEDISFFFTDKALKAHKIRPILIGSTPFVQWTLRYGTDRSAVGTELIAGGTGTTEVTTGIDIETFTSFLIPANSHVWLETTNKTGTVVSLALTLFYSEA